MHLCSTMWCFDTCKHCVMFKLGSTQMRHLVFVTIYEKKQIFHSIFCINLLQSLISGLSLISHLQARAQWLH